MILDSTLIRLEAVLAGAADPAPVSHVWYRVYTNDGTITKPALYRVALNGATDVVILPAPSLTGEVREVLGASWYNADNASITLTIKTDDGTTERTILNRVLLTLQTLHYSINNGWYITTNS